MTRTSRRPRLTQLGAAALIAVASLHAQAEGIAHQLTGWALLPSEARWPGPVTGQFISPDLPVAVPFTDGQPIPGFSGLQRDGKGGWIALPDNGYGTKGNSGDFIIGVYKAAIDFKTRSDGTTTPGAITLKGRVNFNDAKGLLKNGAGLDLVTTADLANYHTVNGNSLVDSGIPVDARITSGRLLTGFDFDVESIAPAPDGTFWVGEEFGPWLLHFDRKGTLIDEPIVHPFLRSPSNPEVMSGTTAVTSQGSRG
ncbi:MAG TPA: esterase-like activity of phytase family protein, partial [Ideonella sp.]|nr:esterase-like activity of phytase family protein [Ideonella sp.]